VVINIAEIIIKISEHSYNLLEESAKGGRFKKESKFKNGGYYISIDKKLYDKLKKIDDDLDKSIFYAVVNDKLRKNE
jgi:hypothetical protein